MVVNMREWNEMDSGELSKKSLREDYITTQELQELRAQKAISASKLAKAKSDYEALLKKQSIIHF